MLLVRRRFVVVVAVDAVVVVAVIAAIIVVVVVVVVINLRQIKSDRNHSFLSLFNRCKECLKSVVFLVFVVSVSVLGRLAM